MKIIATIMSILGITTAAPAFTNLNVKEFEKLIAKKEVTIVDVRTPEEFAAGHIEGAVNVDVNADDFKTKFAALGISKETVIAVYCRSGRRSSNACSILAAEGYKKLFNLSTGIIGWTDASKPVVK